MTSAWGSVRRHLRIDAPADRVWALAGDPGRLAEWFPGVTEATVKGSTRTVVVASGATVTEEIVTLDALQRRLQYRITGPLFRHHLSTLDVVDLGDGSSLVIYGADAAPAVLALVVAGAAGAGLARLRSLVEGAQGAT